MVRQCQKPYICNAFINRYLRYGSGGRTWTYILLNKNNELGYASWLFTDFFIKLNNVLSSWFKGIFCMSSEQVGHFQLKLMWEFKEQYYFVIML